MNHIEIIQQLGQDDSKEVSTIFDAFIRGTIRNTFIDIMADEVSALCGAAYDRSAKGLVAALGVLHLHWKSREKPSGGLEFVDSRIALNAKSILIPTKRLKAYKLSRFEKRSSRPTRPARLHAKSKKASIGTREPAAPK